MPIAIRSDKIILSSEKETEKLANKFLKKLKPGNIVFLYGEIGVGKTTFVRHLINAFQKKNKIELTEVNSPTFNLLNEYEIKKININHYDLFRLKSSQDLNNLDIYKDNSNSIILIEWPQIIDKKPNNLIELIFSYEDDYEKRIVEIKGLNL